MSVGDWVQVNVTVPLGKMLLEPQNLQKIAAVFEPMLTRLVNTAITQVGLEVQATELKVINTIGDQAKASEQVVLSSLTDMSNIISNTIKGLNPFHFGGKCPKCGTPQGE